MSILEKNTGSGIDALIISLIMAKVFLLEYLGMAGIVNNVIFLLWLEDSEEAAFPRLPNYDAPCFELLCWEHSSR